MNNSRFKLHLIITLVLSGLLPIIGSIFLHFFLLGRYWIDEPLHSVFEALGSFTALSLALLILILKKNKRIPSYYMWVSCALISMGILDFFHAFSPPGDSFVWLHGMAILIGGFLFAMIWLPDWMAQSRFASTLPTVAAVAAIIFSVFSVVFPDILPSMVNERAFTTIANAINILSGLFFLLAAVYFVTRYRSERSIGDFLFANFCLLNGWTGLLFPFSQLWYADWWFWHLLRLVAYFTVILYMFLTFQRSEAELEQHRWHLEELVQKRTTELKITNKQLHQEIDERIRVEEALRESKQRYATTLASIGDAVISTDIEGRIAFMNAVAEELTGWTLAEASIKPVKEVFNIINEDTRAEVENPISKVLQEGTVVGLANHTILVREDGTEVPIDDSGAPIRDGDGKTTGVVLVFRDITERKQTEAGLHLFRNLIDQFNDSLFVADAKTGHILDVNDRACRNLGYSREELLNMSVMDVDAIVPDYLTWQRRTTELRKKGYRLLEGKHRRKDGTLFPAEVNIRFIIQDKKEYVVGVARDITERKLAEEKLHRAHDELEVRVRERTSELAKANEALLESEERYRKLVESSPDAIAIHSEGKIVFTNSAGAKLLGAASPEQLIGKEIMDFVHPDYKEAVEERNLLMKEEIKDVPLIEEKLIRLDGSVIDVEVAVTPFIHQGKHGTQAIIRDVTERKQIEEILRERERSYRTLSENLPGIVYRVFLRENNRMQFFNNMVQSMIGYSVEELTIGEVCSLDPLILPEDREHVMAALKYAVMENQPFQVEYHLKHKEGDIRHFLERGRPVYGVDGNPLYIDGVILDITERKKAEEALKQSTEFNETVINSMSDAIAIIDVHNYRIININRVFENAYELKKKDVIGRTCYEITHYRTEPCTPPEDICPLIETLRTGKPSVAEHVHYLKDGAKIYVEVSASPIRNRNGEISQVVHVSRDITERKRAEEKIREQAALLDKANDAIAAMDLENRIIYWNKSAERLYGWNSEEAIDRNASELFYKEESAELIEAKKRVVEEGEWTGELDQITKNGKKIIVESRWTLVHDSKGEPKSILIIDTDITEKKKLEVQFLRAQRLESIGTLAGGIAHDINNVLTPMMLSLQLLQEKLTDNESQNLLNALERSTQRGASLVKQVQSFARGVQGERVALQVVHLVSEIMQIAKETFPRSIEIRTDIQKDLLIISGDATQLHQVIMNLCVNARDAMPEGGILSISAENSFIDENYVRMNIDAKVGQYVVITVSDTGTGIPPEILDRIFEPFFTTKQPGKGTGLGLSTSLAIVKSHGGFITVYSEVGNGTVFKVYLPVVKTTETQKVDEQLELLAGHGESILIVDDEAMVRQITNSILETHGYRVLTANDGKEAIKVYTQNREKIKAVLMDMMMPVMDGQACIRALREANPDIKIIAVSGLAEKEKLAKVPVTHVKAFLPKPYVAKKLLKTIHEVINM